MADPREPKSNGHGCAGSPESSQLEQLAQLTGELAHEIKNPLSTIKVNLKLVQEQLAQLDGVDRQIARVQRKLQVVEQETERLQQILEGFLRYVGKAELDLVRVDLNEVVAGLVDFCWAQLQAQAITLRHQLCPDPLFVRGDSGALKQAILNMILNAQEAMPHGGELILETLRQACHGIIRISDTGMGIAPEQLPRVFAPYFSTKPKGTGLGLAITKKLVEAHHGSITVNSVLGQGSQFVLTFPLVQPPTEA